MKPRTKKEMQKEIDELKKQIQETTRPIIRTLQPSVPTTVFLKPSEDCRCCGKKKHKCRIHDGCDCEWEKPKPVPIPRPLHYNPFDVPPFRPKPRPRDTNPFGFRGCPRCGGNHHWDVSCPRNNFRMR